MGSRDKNPDGSFGAYSWKSYGQVYTEVTNIARCIAEKDFALPVEGEKGQTKRFCGIWAINREEWLVTHFANMLNNVTTIGFFDAMSHVQVNFIIEQTEVQTIFAQAKYVT